MNQSPPASRTRSNKARSNKERERSSPLTSAPADKPAPAPARDMNRKQVEEIVCSCLLQNAVIEKLGNALSGFIKKAVEDAVADALRKVNQEIGRLQSEVTSLKEHVRVLDNQLKCRTDDVEQYTRRNNLRVFGIPETPGEDTDRLIVNLAKEQLGVDLPLEAIERSHRVGSRPAARQGGRERHRPVIVRFCSYRDRRRVFQAKKKLKGTDISIKEDLTVGRLEVLRAAISRFGLKNTWSTDGKIFWISGGDRGSATRLEDIPEAAMDSTQSS